MFGFILKAVLSACFISALAHEPAMIVPLSKHEVPVIRNNRTVMNKTAYYGQISVGLPAQHFSVVFDTGSGHIVLPSVACKTETCKKHRRFNPAHSVKSLSSQSSSPRRTGQVSVYFGTGEIGGNPAYESICFGDAGFPTSCFEGDMILATQMSDTPFSEFVFDGIVGLGLPDLAIGPSFSFLNMMSSSTSPMPPTFGLFLSDVEGVLSELALGGHDAKRTQNELAWEPLHEPQLGYWQVKIRGITVAGKAYEGCADGGCTAIVDSGTSATGVPRFMMKDLTKKLLWQVGEGVTDCRQEVGPGLVFHLEGVDLALSARDYARPEPYQVTVTDVNASNPESSSLRVNTSICRAVLLPVQIDVPRMDRAFIVGEAVLRRYYTAYDSESLKVGFALAAQPRAVLA